MALKLSTVNAVGRNGGSAASETPRNKSQKQGNVSRGTHFLYKSTKAKKAG